MLFVCWWPSQNYPGCDDALKLVSILAGVSPAFFFGHSIGHSIGHLADTIVSPPKAGIVPPWCAICLPVTLDLSPRLGIMGGHNTVPPCRDGQGVAIRIKSLVSDSHGAAVDSGFYPAPALGVFCRGRFQAANPSAESTLAFKSSLPAKGGFAGEAFAVFVRMKGENQQDGLFLMAGMQVRHGPQPSEKVAGFSARRLHVHPWPPRASAGLGLQVRSHGGTHRACPCGAPDTGSRRARYARKTSGVARSLYRIHSGGSMRLHRSASRSGRRRWWRSYPGPTQERFDFRKTEAHGPA